MTFVTAAISAAGGQSRIDAGYRFVQLPDHGCWIVEDATLPTAGERLLERIAAQPGLAEPIVRGYVEDALREPMVGGDSESAAQPAIGVFVSDYRSGVFAHIGDAWLYWFRDGRLAACLGGGGEDTAVEASPLAGGIAAGDALLLCTAGFWIYITDTEMEIDLAKSVHPAEWLHALQMRLLQRDEDGLSEYSAIAIMAE